MEKTDRLHYLKALISACLMVGASVGLCFYSAGVFYEPLAQGLNISLGEASLSTTFMLGFMALVTLAVPALLRKVRFETLLLIGTVLAAGSVLCISFCFNRYFVYLFSALLGCGAALIGMVPATTLINNWFERKKYGATAVVLATSALSAAVFTPLMNYSIESLGWRMGLVIEAVLIVILMFPAVYWHVPLHPAAAGQVPYGNEEAVIEKKKTPMIVIGCYALIAVFSAALIGLPMHFSTLATSVGDTAMTGAVAMSWCMIGNFLFKLVGGWLSDRFKPVLTTGILDLFAVVATAGILICILMNTSGALLPMAFIFGSIFALNELSLPMLVSNRVSRKRYASIYALMNFLSTVATAVSISAVGFLYDSLTSYAWIYFIALAEEVIILLLIWYLIHNEKVDDLVTNANTRSFIEKLRASSHRRKLAREQKAAARKEKEAQERAAQAVREAEATEPVPDRPSSDSVFSRQMQLIDEEPGAVPEFSEDFDASAQDVSSSKTAPSSDADSTPNPAASTDSPAAPPEPDPTVQDSFQPADPAAQAPAQDELPVVSAEPSDPGAGTHMAAPDPRAQVNEDAKSDSLPADPQTDPKTGEPSES